MVEPGCAGRPLVCGQGVSVVRPCGGLGRGGAGAGGCSEASAERSP